MISGENVRGIALDILMESESKASHLVLGRTLSKYQYMDKKERSFISRLTKGTIERRLTLDAMIGSYSSVKIGKMKPLIRNLLRMTAYQIYYMPAVPDAAACNEAVTLAKKRGFRNLSGFVNGVSRSMARHKEDFQARMADDGKDIKTLSFKYAMPEWLCRRWVGVYGLENAIRTFSWFLEDHPTTVRLHRQSGEDGQADAFLETMAAEGIRTEISALIPFAFKIQGYDHLTALRPFQDGQCYIQDESSMLAVLAAGIRPSDRIIDVCAAPGGKSILASEYLKDGWIEARDLTEAKVERIRENIQRTHAEHIRTRVQDARIFVKEDEGQADIVLADLPCSGLGVIGRKPDIKYRITQEDIKALSLLQKEILAVAVRYLKPGGTLIFSTCTVSREENEENVRYMTEELGLIPESLDPYLPEALQGKGTAKGQLLLLPGAYDTDGFFIARLRRK